MQAGYCFVVSPDMLEGAKKNVAMQKEPRHRERMSQGPGFSSAPARTQSRQASPGSSTSRMAATPTRCRRPRPMSRRSKSSLRRIPRAIAGASAVARGESHHRRRARLRQGCRSITSGSMPRAPGQSRWPKAPCSPFRYARCASRTRCGRFRRVAAFQKPAISMGVDACYYRPLGRQPLHHRTRLPEGIRRRRSLQLQSQRRRGFHQRRAGAGRAPLSRPLPA